MCAVAPGSRVVDRQDRGLKLPGKYISDVDPEHPVFRRITNFALCIFQVIDQHTPEIGTF